MRRREFIKIIAGSAVAWPFAARAEQTKRRIGVLLYSKQELDFISPFFRGLEALGYADGKNITIEYRDANGQTERLQKAVDELVRLNPEVIFSFGAEQAPYVKKATTTIPIVVVVSADPVESGLVASLGRPGGNITGLTYIHDVLAGKSVELLKEVAPRVSRAAILWDPNHVSREFEASQRAAHALGMQLQSLEVREPRDFESAFQAATREHPEALIVLGSRFLFRNRQLIADFVEKNRVILVGVPRWLIDIGAVLSYGPNAQELFRRASTFVDKILKGARPADLPMQQPVTFELTINVKAAKRLGVTVPTTLLARADEVIE
jgi:putative ABC transport system substrate-binding protein